MLLALFRGKMLLRGFVRQKQARLALMVAVWLALAAFLALSSVSYANFYSALGALGGVSARIFAAQAALITALLLMQFVPSLAADMFDPQSSLRYFLTMPISRGALVVSAMMTSAMGAVLPLAILVPMCTGYIVASRGVGAPFGVAAFGLFAAGLGLCAAAALMMVTQGAKARRMARWTAIINVLAFVFIWQFMPRWMSDVRRAAAAGDVEHLRRVLEAVGSAGGALELLSMLFRGEPVIVAAFGIAGVALWRLGWVMSRRLSFEKPLLRRAAPKRAEDVPRLPKKPFAWRDGKLIRRDAETFLLVVYPVAFGIIFGFFVNRSVAVGTIMTAVLASQYQMLLSVKLVAFDTRNCLWASALPVRWRRVILARAVYTSFAWTAAVLLVGCVLMVLCGRSAPLVLCLPPAFATFVAASTVAQRKWLLHPNRDAVPAKTALGLSFFLPALVAVFAVGLPLGAWDLAPKLGVSRAAAAAVAFAPAMAFAAAELVLAIAMLPERVVRKAMQR